MVVISDLMLLSRLREELIRAGGSIEWDTQVTSVFRRGERAVLETVDGRQFEAELVIAADGSHST